MLVLPFQRTTSRRPSASSSNIWEEVERDAILAAAWESRAAEQSALANHRGSTRPNNLSRMGTTKAADSGDSDDDDDILEIAKSSSSSSGYGSKMFQSVMTRVGTNGRIFGAYPNDAPPINECANERGVIQLARRYGYGNWKEADDDSWYEYKEDDLIQSDNDKEDGGDGSWGGGDLIFGADGIEEDVDDEFDVEERMPSRRRKSQRRTKKQNTSMISDVEPAIVKTRRRKRSSKGEKRGSSITLGLSGGGGMVVDTSSGNKSIPKSRFTFEVGVGASSSKQHGMKQRSDQSRTSISAAVAKRRSSDAILATRSIRQSRDATIQSQLRDRKSSILFASDTNIKAPMQTLNKSNPGLEKNDDQMR